MKFYNTALQKEMTRIHNKQNEDSNFISRNFDLKVVMFWILYPIAALWSIFTAGSHLYHHFNSVFSSVIITAIFTLILVLGIEIGKYFFAKATMEDLVEGVVAEDGYHKAAFVMKLAGVLACFTFSILLSIKGAPVSADNWKATFAPIELISLDSINVYYDEKIAVENTSFDKGSQSLWKGKPTDGGLEVMQNAQTAKENIEAQREMALGEAREENKTRRATYQLNTANTGDWFMGLAGIGEAICIICLLFGGNYEAGSRKNLAIRNNPSLPSSSNQQIGFFQQSAINHNTPPINQQPNELNYPFQNDRRPIGFHRPTTNNKQLKMHQLPVATDVSAISRDAEAFQMAYKHCKKNRDSWLSKEREGLGRTATNRGNAEKWELAMNYYKKRFEKLKNKL